MALKMLKNGQYEVKTLKDAKEALEGMQNLKNEIDELMKEHGIDEMMQDAAEMKKAATAFAVSMRRKPSDPVKIQCDGFHATLIEAPYDSHFIGTKDDLLDAPEVERKLVPLRTIIFRRYRSDKAKAKEVWMGITKRVVDKQKVEEAVAEGLLTVDEIAPSFVEKMKAPYLRLFDD